MHRTQTDYQIQQIRQLNKYQDILDVFIHIMILRLPIAFILINMTLMIWLVQTIFSSFSADSIPKSLFLFAPSLLGMPVTDIKFQPLGCQPDYEQVYLKTFPTLTYQGIKHANLTKWQQSQIVCIKKSDKIPDLYTSNCSASNSSTIPIYCSGLCVSQQIQCPITGIRKINAMQTLQPYESQFYKSKDNLYKYIYTRENKQSYVVSISATYETRCANQFRYFDTFSNFSQYWNKSQDCGNQGVLSAESYHPFDYIDTSQFLFNNGIWKENIQKIAKYSRTEIGFINNIKYNQKLPECVASSTAARKLAQNIIRQPVKPLLSKNLLIISFIFFTVCWAWLFAFYWCQAESVFKNPFVLLLALIQFITISFIYFQNQQTFSYQQQIKKISDCVDQVTLKNTIQSWSFGIANSGPLIGILYACSAYVLLQLMSYFCNYFIYVPYVFIAGSRPNILDGEESYISVWQD